MKNLKMNDGNSAVADVAYRASETIAIYPITPASPMSELCEKWSSVDARPNVWGIVPSLSELQSEGGAAGAVHGALQTGTLTTTFTASQGLLLMIPNMYKIAGELQSFVMHVPARALSNHALSIFGDHTDVMACRQTGFGILSSNSVQEAHDMALIAHSITLSSRIPFIHFYDGFRTSYEINGYVPIPDEDVKAMIPYSEVEDFRSRAISPDRPFVRGTAQNPDSYFQSWEARNKFYERCVGIVTLKMEQFAGLTGRVYEPYQYVGSPVAEKVAIVMGSGAETLEEVSNFLNSSGEKVGVLKVRMYRPFDTKLFIKAIPKTAKYIAVLDRTKELGALGEPLYVDVSAAILEAQACGIVPNDFHPIVLGGRYGLGSKDFSPAMARAVFDNLTTKGINRFSVGIDDDVGKKSLSYDSTFELHHADRKSAVFYGLGSDGTDGANKNSIKIIGENTDLYAQGFFVYDSRKSGSVTVSHLRFGSEPIHAPYLIDKADFVACHEFSFMQRYKVLERAKPNAIFLLNSIYGADEVWEHLNRDVQSAIIEKNLDFRVIDAYKVARKVGLGRRINTVMQTCFFALVDLLPENTAIEKIQASIKSAYSDKGDDVVKKNFAAVDDSIANLHKVVVPKTADAHDGFPPVVPESAPDFVKRVTSKLIAEEGDSLPVSAMPVDGTWPSDTSKWEKRNIAIYMPVWNPSICIQCATCACMCPHAAIRVKFYPKNLLKSAPETFKHTQYKSDETCAFTVQVSSEDCTGCGVCANVCPGKSQDGKSKALEMAEQAPLRAQEAHNFEFFMSLPNPDRTKLSLNLRDSQFRQPLFEFSSACAGCGETPYIKLITQLFGDRLYIANATGCSSIYGGNLPTSPYAINPEGRGPTWANSLFEDNAEFGYGFRLSIDKENEMARDLVVKLSQKIGEKNVKEILEADQSSESGIVAQRARITELKKLLAKDSSFEARALLSLADSLVKKSVWAIGGDGWAYDIGYGGLDHIVARGRNINILIMDTQVYSNTGGQMSKATPIGAVAKFASCGKSRRKKDIGMLVAEYGTAYVAQIALAANPAQAIRAISEADSFDGTSVIIAYCPCISHGYNLVLGPQQQRKAVDSGFWPLYRFNPNAEKALVLDSKDPKIPVSEFMEGENRFNMLKSLNKERAEELQSEAQKYVDARWERYKYLAGQK